MNNDNVTITYIVLSSVILTVFTLLSLNWFYLRHDKHAEDDHFPDLIILLTRIIPLLLVANTYYNWGNHNHYISGSLIVGYIVYCFIPFLSCPTMTLKGSGLIYIPNILAVFDKSRCRY